MTISLEDRALIAYMASTAVPFVVTATVNHSTLTSSGYVSNHVKQGTDGQGLAVDFAERWGGGSDAPGLAAIYQALLPLAPHCAELIYAGPGGGFWKNGVRVGPYAAADHHDHVHIAVPLGFIAAPLQRSIPTMPDDPNLPNIQGPCSFHPIFDSAGHCTGYYIFGTKSGEVHAFGPGTQYYGRSEVISNL